MENNNLNPIMQRRQVLAARLEQFEKGIDFRSDDIDTLEKGGEGSRGGKVIGHTKSGKPIYEDKHGEHYKDFTDKDHEDAREVHYSLNANLRKEAIKKYGESTTGQPDFSDEKQQKRYDKEYFKNFDAGYSHEAQTTSHKNKIEDYKKEEKERKQIDKKIDINHIPKDFIKLSKLLGADERAQHKETYDDVKKKFGEETLKEIINTFSKYKNIFKKYKGIPFEGDYPEFDSMVKKDTSLKKLMKVVAYLN